MNEVNRKDPNRRREVGDIVSAGGLSPLVEIRYACESDFEIVKYLATWISMPPLPKPSAVKSARPRTDGRRTLLVYLDGELIKELKRAALDEERNVYEIVEEASRDWLRRNGKQAVIKNASRRERAVTRMPKKKAIT
jgi:hypothetical protein